VQNAHWNAFDLLSGEFPEKDLTVMSYVTGELAPSSIEPLIEKAWRSARHFLVIIEPGTPAGFERIRAIRSQLISLGGHVVAPCPHGNACPMAGGDWCHFSVRLDRSSFHRQCKDGELTYEDEKYSYVIFSKEPHAPSGPRILRPRHRHTGHINFPKKA
jgi:ribosomal protein RSM22 (predicted rRNA methylase)